MLDDAPAAGARDGGGEGFRAGGVTHRRGRVSDWLAEHAAAVARLVREAHGAVVVCGPDAMQRGVRETVGAALWPAGGAARADGLAALEAAGSLLFDSWSFAEL